MQPDVEVLGRASQILLYWHDADIHALCSVLARVSDLDEAKDIMVAMAMLADGDEKFLREITLKNIVIT